MNAGHMNKGLMGAPRLKPQEGYLEEHRQVVTCWPLLAPPCPPACPRSSVQKSEFGRELLPRLLPRVFRGLFASKHVSVFKQFAGHFLTYLQ